MIAVKSIASVATRLFLTLSRCLSTEKSLSLKHHHSDTLHPNRSQLRVVRLKSL
jgi:hypothetical protein